MKTQHTVGAAIFAIFLIAGPAAVAATGNERTESAALYKQHCAMCHGQDATGHTPIGKKFNIPDLLSSTVQRKTDAELTEVIANGKQKMPAFKTQLKPEQVKDLVTYIRELPKLTTSVHE